MTATERYAELQQRIRTMREAAVAAAREAFAEGTQLLFNEHPTLDSFGWTQYTPYFNDGDECVFRVNNWEPYINGMDPYGDDDDRDELAWEQLSKQVRQFLTHFDDDTMRDLFGDHAMITIHRLGQTTVEEYSHD